MSLFFPAETTTRLTCHAQKPALCAERTEHISRRATTSCPAHLCTALLLVRGSDRKCCLGGLSAVRLFQHTRRLSPARSGGRTLLRHLCPQHPDKGGIALALHFVFFFSFAALAETNVRSPCLQAHKSDSAMLLLLGEKYKKRRYEAPPFFFSSSPAVRVLGVERPSSLKRVVDVTYAPTTAVRRSRRLQLFHLYDRFSG